MIMVYTFWSLGNFTVHMADMATMVLFYLKAFKITPVHSFQGDPAALHKEIKQKILTWWNSMNMMLKYWKSLPHIVRFL